MCMCVYYNMLCFVWRTEHEGVTAARLYGVATFKVHVCTLYNLGCIYSRFHCKPVSKPVSSVFAFNLITYTSNVDLFIVKPLAFMFCTTIVILQEGLQLTEQKISDKLMSKMSEILEGGKAHVFAKKQLYRIQVSLIGESLSELHISKYYVVSEFVSCSYVV